MFIISDDGKTAEDISEPPIKKRKKKVCKLLNRKCTTSPMSKFLFDCQQEIQCNKV